MTTKYLDENGLRHLLSEIRSDVTPIKDGTATVGTSKKLAKADHVHPKVTPSDIGAIATNSFSSVTGKPTDNQTPSFGSTFTISQISQDTSGQISATDRTVKIPDSTATTTAAGLMASADKVKLNGLRIFYGTCSTVATQANKSVICETYDALTACDILVVDFSVDNQATAPITLNVNATGAITVKQLTNGALVDTGAIGGVCVFVYDGTYWVLQGSDTDTTYSTATTSANGLMSSSDKTKLNGIATGAEVNVNADWNATSGDAQILNKPTIPTAGTGTSYPKMDGTRALGSQAGFARVDHVHPTDTSRAASEHEHSTGEVVYEDGSQGYDGQTVTAIIDDICDEIALRARLASPAFTGTPTAPTATAGTNTTQIATTAFVKAAVDAAATGAVAYQGTVPISGQTGGFAPTNTTAGWYWIVQTAGTYAGVVCEAGDMIFCRVTSSTYSASNFDVIQTNLDIATMTNAEIEAAISA